MSTRLDMRVRAHVPAWACWLPLAFATQLGAGIGALASLTYWQFVFWTRYPGGTYNARWQELVRATGERIENSPNPLKGVDHVTGGGD